jgi:hypothetical protein
MGTERRLGWRDYAFALVFVFALSGGAEGLANIAAGWL